MVSMPILLLLNKWLPGVSLDDHQPHSCACIAPRRLPGPRKTTGWAEPNSAAYTQTVPGPGGRGGQRVLGRESLSICNVEGPTSHQDKAALRRKEELDDRDR